VTTVTDRDNRDRPELTRTIIEPYVLSAEGEFTTDQIRRHFEIESRSAKDNLRQILGRMVKEGVLRRGRRDGVFERVDIQLEEMDWGKADGEPLPILWPLDLHKYCHVFAPGIGIISGSSNAGKSAFCMQFCELNKGLGQRLVAFDNESGPQLYARRLRTIGETVTPPWKVYQRDHQFDDVINPDAISVIDYLPIPQEVYTLQSQVDAIWRRLRGGFCLIALQKPKGRDDAFGGFMLRGRAQLYMALDTESNGTFKLKVVKAKTPVDPSKNPNDKEWTFWLERGVHFMNPSNPFGDSR